MRPERVTAHGLVTQCSATGGRATHYRVRWQRTRHCLMQRLLFGPMTDWTLILAGSLAGLGVVVLLTVLLLGAPSLLG